MEELRLVTRTHAEIFVHLRVLRLYLQPLLLRQVRDLPRVDFYRTLYRRLVLERLRLDRSYLLQLFGLIAGALDGGLVLGRLDGRALAAHELLPDFVRLFESVHKL